LGQKVNEKQPRVSGRANITRLLWLLGLVAGIAIGAAAAFGLAGTNPLSISVMQ
jgi:hypothetical protein